MVKALALSGGGARGSLSNLLNEGSALIAVPGVNIAGGPIIASELQQLRGMIVGLLAENAITNHDPVGPLGRLEASPAAVDFGAARIGDQLGTNVTLTNAGDQMRNLARDRAIRRVRRLCGAAVAAHRPRARCDARARRIMHRVRRASTRGRLVLAHSGSPSGETVTFLLR